MRQPNNEVTSQQGFALILVTVVSVIVLSLISSSLYLIHRQLQIAKLSSLQLQALVCAESGLAKGKLLIHSDPNYFTDVDYVGTTANIKIWAISNTQGHVEAINNGYFKVVKEQTKHRLFSIGYLGSSAETAAARKVLQLDYSISFGKVVSCQWQEL